MCWNRVRVNWSKGYLSNYDWSELCCVHTTYWNFFKGFTFGYNHFDPITLNYWLLKTLFWNATSSLLNSVCISRSSLNFVQISVLILIFSCHVVWLFPHETHYLQYVTVRLSWNGITVSSDEHFFPIKIGQIIM